MDQHPDIENVKRLHQAYSQLTEEIGKVIVGQQRVLEELLIAMFAGGHCLLVGVPGLAKTLMVHTLADSLSLAFSRIQFTPDLMPADITGTEVLYEDRATGARELKFLPGPIFANIVLADEINRTPPKTQAALLEAMQERQVTSGGERRELPQPFFVLATQNPIEQEGTYPLPEAQLDRFMFQVQVDYPNENEELEIVQRTTSDETTSVGSSLQAADIEELQRLVRKIPIAEPMARQAIQLVRLSRPQEAAADDFVRQYIAWGAGPRASQQLVLAAKSRAALRGRYAVKWEDIAVVAPAVLRHRILANYNAEAENVSTGDVINHLLERVRETA